MFSNNALQKRLKYAAHFYVFNLEPETLRWQQLACFCILANDQSPIVSKINLY